MNISELSASVYGTNLTSINQLQEINQVREVLEKSSTTQSFADTLDEEVSKVSEFKELASVLDKSVLGTMVENASETDLKALSEDLLGTSGGREVLSSLMDGHFQQVVMSESDDDDDNTFAGSLDTFSQSVSETQTLMDNLSSLMETLNTTEE